jgi:uncharacterized membrane protein YphA (DoxX/SURF4 family)
MVFAAVFLGYTHRFTGALAPLTRTWRASPKVVAKDSAIEGYLGPVGPHTLRCNGLMMSAPGRYALQRLFSTFPGGRPGLGLLLLRTALGFTAAAAGVFTFAIVSVARAESWLLGGVLLVSGVALAVGLLTPAAAVLVAVCFAGIAASWLPAPGWSLQDTGTVAGAMIVCAIAISLLGPGAFSLDGRLFGRREIVIPPSIRPPES